MNSGSNSTKHTTESIKAGMAVGFKGIFTIAEFGRRPLKPVTFRWAVGGWIVFSLSTFVLGVPIYDLIVDMVNQLIVWIPCILGFTIGGYSFLIGFVQPGLMQKISEPREGSKFTFFQTASASFASNLVLQGIALIVAFVVHYAIYLDTKRTLKFQLNPCAVSGINFIVYLLVGLCFAIALAVVIQLIVNVFNFSQLHHYNTNKEKLDAKEKMLQEAKDDILPPDKQG